jgi:hypothetical protein
MHLAVAYVRFTDCEVPPGTGRCGRAGWTRSAQEPGNLRRAIGVAAHVEIRRIDGDLVHGNRSRERVEPCQRDVDRSGGRQCRAVRARHGKLVDARSAGQCDRSRDALVGCEDECEARRQRTVAHHDAARQRHIFGIARQRQCVEVQVELRLLRVLERRRRTAGQRECRAVDRAVESRRHVDLRVVRKARQERNADPDPGNDDFSVVRAIVERHRTVVDLDVVDREVRRRPFRLLPDALDQIVDVVAAIGVAHEVDLRTRQPDRVEHRRALPERLERKIDVERFEPEQRPLRLAIGHCQVEEPRTQRERIEFQPAQRRLSGRAPARRAPRACPSPRRG